MPGFALPLALEALAVPLPDVGREEGRGLGSAASLPWAWACWKMLEVISALPTGITPAILRAELQGAWEGERASRKQRALLGDPDSSAPTHQVPGPPCLTVKAVLQSGPSTLTAHLLDVQWTGVPPDGSEDAAGSASPGYMLLRDPTALEPEEEHEVLENAGGKEEEKAVAPTVANAKPVPPIHGKGRHVLHMFAHAKFAFLMVEPFRSYLLGRRLSLFHVPCPELFVAGAYRRLALPCPHAVFWLQSKAQAGLRAEDVAFLRDCFPSRLSEVGLTLPDGECPSFVLSIRSIGPVGVEGADASAPPRCRVVVQDDTKCQATLTLWGKQLALLHVLHVGDRIALWRPFLPDRHGEDDPITLEVSSCTILFLVQSVAPELPQSMDELASMPGGKATSIQALRNLPAQAVSFFAHVTGLQCLGAFWSLEVADASGTCTLSLDGGLVRDLLPGHVVFVHRLQVCKGILSTRSVRLVNVSRLTCLLRSPFLCRWSSLSDATFRALDAFCAVARVVELQDVTCTDLHAECWGKLPQGGNRCMRCGATVVCPVPGAWAGGGSQVAELAAPFTPSPPRAIEGRVTLEDEGFRFPTWTGPGVLEELLGCSAAAYASRTPAQQAAQLQTLRVGRWGHVHFRVSVSRIPQAREGEGGGYRIDALVPEDRVS